MCLRKIMIIKEAGPLKNENKYFGWTPRRVKIRKRHVCRLCGEAIPKGRHAYVIHGMIAGEWVHVYKCEWCHKKYPSEYGCDSDDQEE